eukprot:9492660-Pyramimonas_sp.AAC.1
MMRRGSGGRQSANTATRGPVAQTNKLYGTIAPRARRRVHMHTMMLPLLAVLVITAILLIICYIIIACYLSVAKRNEKGEIDPAQI